MCADNEFQSAAALLQQLNRDSLLLATGSWMLTTKVAATAAAVHKDELPFGRCGVTASGAAWIDLYRQPAGGLACQLLDIRLELCATDETAPAAR